MRKGGFTLLYSSVLSHFSPVHSAEERHLAYLNQSPRATASYRRYVVQGITSSLKVMPIPFTFFKGEKNPLLMFFSWEGKWPFIAEKHTGCAIKAESSPRCFDWRAVWIAGILSLLYNRVATFCAAYTSCCQLNLNANGTYASYCSWWDFLSFNSKSPFHQKATTLNVPRQGMPNVGWHRWLQVKRLRYL